MRNIISVLVALLCVLPVWGSTQNHWSFDATGFEKDMELFTILKLNGEVVPDFENYDVAAFCGDECRGVAEVVSIGNTGSQLYSLRIYGVSENETITFRCFDRQKSEETELLQKVSFRNNARIGTPSSPYLLSLLIQLVPEEGTNIIYVSPDGTSDGRSRQSPTGDIQAAIDAAQSTGGTVCLLAGEYRCVSTIMLRYGVTVAGELNGTVVLDGGNLVRIFEIEQAVGNEKQVLISNLIVKNGYTDGNGAGALLNEFVSVEKCLFLGNKASGYGGAVSGGKLNYCTLVRNEAILGGGAVYDSEVRNSILWNNGVESVKGAYSLRYVAVEEDGILAGTHLIYLSSSNDIDMDKTVAPRFATVTEGANAWTLSEESPLLKMAEAEGNQFFDLGMYQTSYQGIAYTKVDIPDKLVYGEILSPVVEVYNAYRDVLTSVPVTLFFRNGEDASWKREAPEVIGSYQVKARIESSGSFWKGTEDGEQISGYTIVSRPLTLTVNAATKIYGEPDPEYTYILSEELKSGNELTGTIRRTSGENCGTYTLYADEFTAGSNYDLEVVCDAGLTIEKRPVTVSCKKALKVYGESDPQLQFTYTGELPFNDEFSGQLARVAGEHAGSYEILQGTLLLSDNYRLSFQSEALTIVPRPLIVEIDNQEKVYGEEDKELTFRVKGLLGQDVLSGMPAREEGEDAGTYNINVGSLSSTPDYDITMMVPGVYTILPAIAKVEISSLKFSYDGQSKSVQISTNPSGLVCEITYNDSFELPENVGSYQVKAVVNDRNYTGEKNAVLVITEPIMDVLVYSDIITKSGSSEIAFTVLNNEFLRDTRLQFFNSRGKLVYDKRNYENGEYNMQGLDIGTYYFVYSYLGTDGLRHRKKGFTEVIE